MTDKPKVIEFHSTDSPTILFACSWCQYTTKSEDDARLCCLCPTCGERVKGPGRQACDKCRAAAYAEREAERYARDMALPVVEDKGEPVLAGDKFYENADAAAEAIWDDGGDPTKVIAYPCTVGRSDTPLIQELVEEHWYCQFEDPDMISMSKELAAACTEFQKQLEAEAPVMWSPRTKERIALPAIDESKVVHLHAR